MLLGCGQAMGGQGLGGGSWIVTLSTMVALLCILPPSVLW